MEPGTVRSIFQWFLRRFGCEAQASEAFGYEIYEADGEKRFDLLAHIRGPDKASTEQRQVARDAFLKLAEPFVRRSAAGVVEVEVGHDGKQPMFCLVSLLWEWPPGPKTPRVVFGFIVRCADIQEAHEKLRVIQGACPKPRGE